MDVSNLSPLLICFMGGIINLSLPSSSTPLFLIVVVFVVLRAGEDVGLFFRKRVNYFWSYFM